MSTGGDGESDERKTKAELCDVSPIVLAVRRSHCAVWAEALGVPDLQRGGLLDQDRHHHLGRPALGDSQGASEDLESQDHKKHSEIDIRSVRERRGQIRG